MANEEDHEYRLKAMTDVFSGTAWDLNNEDRDAIRWALERIKELKELKEVIDNADWNEE